MTQYGVGQEHLTLTMAEKMKIELLPFKLGDFNILHERAIGHSELNICSFMEIYIFKPYMGPFLDEGKINETLKGCPQ